MNVLENDSLWLADLSYLGVLRVSGQDRRGFLQGQLTQNLDHLSPEQSILSGWTSPKGRLLAISQLFDWQDSIWMLMPADLIDGVAKRLAMYVLRADVRLENCQISVTGLRGTKAIAATEALGMTLINEPNASASTENVCIGRVAGDPSRLVALGDLSGYPTPSVKKRGSVAWRLLNIRSGIPTIFPATAESFVPQMVNLDLCGGVSFTKGCYTGQEIVARTQNLGRVKRRMFRFTDATGTKLAPGQAIFCTERPAGQVVDAVSDGTGTELLAVVPLNLGDNNLYLDESATLRLDPAAMPYKVRGLTG